MNGTMKSKAIKLTKSRLLWKTTPQMVFDQNGHGQSVYSASYRLPLDTVQVEHVARDSGIVYDFGETPRRTAVIGGGGRFIHKREFIDGQLVAQSIVFRDVLCNSEPVFEVVIAYFQTKSGEKK